MERQTSAKGRKKYDPVDCPKHGGQDLCTAINKWAQELYAWALDVEKAIWPGGPPGGSNPPPPPPFK